MKPLVVIPARGGSKGVPGKNIKPLGGRPLIQHTIAAAQQVFRNEQICVSTDDPAIRACAEETGLTVPFLRPDALATDTAGTYEVLLHALEFYRQQGYVADVLLLLQPTSPFRTARHIREALALYTPAVEMVVSVKETRANPYYVLFEEDSRGFLQPSKPAHFSRRQDCPRVWEYNGALYIINVAALRQKPLSQFQKKVKYVMDERSSHDIDTPFDWLVAECLATRSGETPTSKSSP